MPKQTFFNLKDEKQQRIIKAAGEEFSQHNLYDSSINNIIKMAKIPRGSFYQYFDDLADLYGYYFSLILEDIQEKLIDGVKEANGDIFTAVRKYAVEYMEEIIAGNHRDFYKNFFLSANVSVQTEGKHHPGFIFYRSDRMRKLVQELKKAVDWNQLKVTNEKEQRMIQHFIMMIFFHAFATYFLHADEKQLTLDSVQAEIDHNLDWLEYGVRKTEDK